MIQIAKEDLYAKGFSSMEIDLGGRIFNAIVKVKYDQPVEEGWIYGTSPVPVKRTKGRQKEGTGELEWADIDDSQRFVDELGDGYTDKIWNATFTYYRAGQPTIRHQLFECRVLNMQDDHGEGNESLHETTPISFKTHLRNGKRAVAIY